MKKESDVEVREVVFGKGHRAAICCSLLGTNLAELLNELKVILPKEPDVLEWRADYFSDINHIQEVLLAAKKLREEVDDTVLLFTIRSHEEGGRQISLSEPKQELLYFELIKEGSIDMLDIELASSFARNKLLVKEAKKQQMKLVFSTHFFTETPPATNMTELLTSGEKAGADLVKLAVMPKNEQDVLTLLKVSYEAASTLAVPVITIAMGQLGVSTRLIGDQFGSSMTFAVGHQASAPGQVPIEVIQDLQTYTMK